METFIEDTNSDFTDFPEEGQEQESRTVPPAIQRELTETEKFKKDFDEELEAYDDPEAEFANLAIEYIQASGDVDDVSLVSYSRGNTVAIDGWSFKGDEDLTYIDLFLSVYRNPATDTRISRNEIEPKFNKMKRFFEMSAEGRTLVGTETVSDIYQIAQLIYETKKIDRLRLFIMTNAIAPADYDPDNSEMPSGTTVEYHIWDARRIMQQDNIMRGKVPVVVDFDAEYNSPLPCIMMPDVSESVNCYLAIIPGTVLADIYHKYHQQILEKNVRTFLQFKGASNKGIRDTLIGHRPTAAQLRKGDLPRDPEPDMFFAYNNGISTTASEVVIKETEGGQFITCIKDWQIVNGGQTTASISTVMSMKDVDKAKLSHVYVSMKVSVLKKKDDGDESSEAWDEIVGRISRYANTQSAVKKSDFNINEPFLVELERLSRQEWVMSSENKPVSKWFFERTRGQYMDKLKHCPTKKAEKEFESEYPKSQMFDKTMLSKYMMAWLQDPASVCKGGENNYQKFYTRLHQEAYHFDERKYHHAIAKAVLFNTIDAYYGKDGIQLQGYKSNMVAYTLSALSWLSEKKLDLERIWKEQCVLSPSLLSELTIPIASIYARLINGVEHIFYKVVTEITTDEDGFTRYLGEIRDIPKEELNKLRATALYKVLLYVKKIEPIIWKVLIEDVEQGQNVNEWTKSQRCWEVLKATLTKTDLGFLQENLSPSGCDDDDDDDDVIEDADLEQDINVNEDADEDTINTNEWTKSQRCWGVLKDTLTQSGLKFPQDLLSSSGDGDDEITDGQRRVIDEMKEVSADVWISISRWARETLLFTPRETAFMGLMGYRIKRRLNVSYSQAKWAIALLEKAKARGWSDR